MKRFQDMPLSEVHKQLQVLMVQSAMMLSNHQRASCALSSFEISYSNEDKLIAHAAYVKTKQRLNKTLKLSALQLARVNQQIDSISDYLDSLDGES